MIDSFVFFSTRSVGEPSNWKSWVLPCLPRDKIEAWSLFPPVKCSSDAGQKCGHHVQCSVAVRQCVSVAVWQRGSVAVSPCPRATPCGAHRPCFTYMLGLGNPVKVFPSFDAPNSLSLSEGHNADRPCQSLQWLPWISYGSTFTCNSIALADPHSLPF